MTYTRFDRKQNNPKRQQPKPGKSWRPRLLIAAGSVCLIGLIATVAVSAYVYSLYKELPDIERLVDFKYDLPTRVMDRNGKLAAEYYEQRRILIRYDQIPTIVRNAVLAIEDNRFKDHWGIDPIRIIKAALVNLASWSFKEGASTLTQQTAKQFLLTPEKNLERKIKEILLALQIEQKFSKDEILGMYLNKAFFGRQSYGIEAASQNYFSKSLAQLDIPEAAMLAGLLRAPSRYSPTRDIALAKKRRDLVLSMMLKNEYITKEEEECSLNSPINLKPGGRRNVPGVSYYIEEIRRTLLKSIGKEELITGGYRIFTTMDLDLQVKAQKSLERGMETIDRRHGYRGPERNIRVDDEIPPDTVAELVKRNFSESPPYLTGVVLDVSADSLKLDLGRHFGRMGLENADWAVPHDLNTLVHENNLLKDLNSAFRAGDVIFVRPVDQSADAAPLSLGSSAKCMGASMNDAAASPAVDESSDRETPEQPAKKEIAVSLYQIPENNGALISMNPKTGEVLAMAGGYSFGKSQFNRATQSFRQPGSAFKPFVYATALEQGYKTGDLLEDTPIVFNDFSSRFSWVPKNYGGRFDGTVNFREALTRSKNIPTIKIARDIGVSKVIELLERTGIDTSKLTNDLSLSLGSGSLTLIDMVTAYSMFPSLGKVPKPIYITRIEDRDGKTIYRETRESRDAINPETAFIMHTILRDVVRRGTGRAAQAINRESAGKTGTTNNNTDAWYIGYIPDLITGVYVGNDSPIIPLGLVETGGRAAAPIWIDFMKFASGPDKPEFSELDIPQPAGVVAVKIDRQTGNLACKEKEDSYFEYYLAGTQPKNCQSGPMEALNLNGTNSPPLPFEAPLPDGGEATPELELELEL